jgi:hypothetical protein
MKVLPFRRVRINTPSEYAVLAITLESVSWAQILIGAASSGAGAVTLLYNRCLLRGRDFASIPGLSPSRKLDSPGVLEVQTAFHSFDRVLEIRTGYIPEAPRYDHLRTNDDDGRYDRNVKITLLVVMLLYGTTALGQDLQV